jgi:hypothetical protein
MRFEGKLFNCGVVIYQGRVLGLVPKTYLPNYREFYEKRQFTSGRQAISREVLFLGERVCQSPKFHPVPGCLTLVLCNLGQQRYIPFPKLLKLKGNEVLAKDSLPVTIMAMRDYKLAQSAHPISMGFKWGYMHSTLFQYGFNLLSCKNVEEREAQPDQKLQRARAKHGKTPFSSYRELEVTVPRSGRHYEKIRDEAKLETILRRSHTVRGHIAEYTEEHKLFGKLTGRFWRTEHTWRELNNSGILLVT